VSTRDGGRVISDNKAFKGGMIVYRSAWRLLFLAWRQNILYDLSADPLYLNSVVEGLKFAQKLQRDHVGMSKGMKREKRGVHYSTTWSAPYLITRGHTVTLCSRSI